MVQSFDHEALQYFEQINSEFIKEQALQIEIASTVSQFTQHPLNVATLYLHNFYSTDKHSPIEEMVSMQGCGGHLAKCPKCAGMCTECRAITFALD